MESFEKIHDHPLIDEIVIVDDFSDMDKFNELYRLIYYGDYKAKHKDLDSWKIKLFRNEENLGMSRNKLEAISKAKNEWCILFDSDNIVYPEYLNSLKDEFFTNKKIIFHPEFAEPEHSYKKYIGQVIAKHNAKNYLHQREFKCLLNTGNYIVNRDEYLRVYKYDPSVRESDAIYFNTLWLEAGNGFFVVPGMVYHHRKHKDSGWIKGDHEYNLKQAAELQKKIKNL
jgi:glycosyltransferase involved in cell wall biosynthesis